MIRKLVVVLLFALPLFAATEELAFDARKSSIAFTASKVVMGRESGEFRKFQGSIRFEEGKPESSGVAVEIDMNSVVAGQPGLTRHLKDPDFFDVRKYPLSSFTSTSVRLGEKDKYVVTGVLDFHGVKKQISFPAAIRYDADSVDVDAQFTINRKQFGIEYDGAADNIIKDDVIIRLRVKAPRPKS